MSKLKKIILTLIATLALGVSCFFLWASNQYVVPIVMYHHVDDVEHKMAPTVHPDTFSAQMAYLKERHFNVISLNELVKSLRDGEKLSRNSVVITFDDGYDNNYTKAFPILKKYDFPATLFVSSDYVGQEGYVTIDQLQEMRGHKIVIGSHTRHHAYLPDLSAEEQRDEIMQSKAILEEKLDGAVQYFSYPVGGFSDSIKTFVKDAGYQAAVTTNRGFDKSNQDIFEINRVKVGGNDESPIKLWAKFSGYYNILRSPKNPY